MMREQAKMDSKLQQLINTQSEEKVGRLERM